MTENIVRSQIQAVEELINKNLEIVQKALGIESAIVFEELPEQGSQKSQLELKPELTNKELRQNVIDNKNSQDKLSERQHCLAIQAVEELINKNLEIVQEALGIEPIINVEELPEQGSQKSQLELKPELTNKELRQNVIDNKNSQDKLSERQHYLAAKKIEVQAMFAESRAKFVARQQAKKSSHHL